MRMVRCHRGITVTVYTFRISATMDRACEIQQLVADSTPRRVDALQESAAHLITALHLLHAAGYDPEQVLRVALLPTCVKIVRPDPEESELH